MKTFFCKLLPPRPSFPADITPDEMLLMQQHAQYWLGWMARGCVVAFGPVADPRGSYGIGILEVEDDGEVQRFTANDPVILADCGFAYEVQPMPRGAVHRPFAAA
ncbi:MAG TPA: YciI family protein [Mizugakiibacter sp.]